jgi:hypothetical protein
MKDIDTLVKQIEKLNLKAFCRSAKNDSRQWDIIDERAALLDEYRKLTGKEHPTE